MRPALPAVSRQAWVRTPVDRFVLARLDREKLAPSPEADRQTLLRRVTLDLTGLPPTPAEIDAFVADTAPGAYERVVDRLLASPRYGERWARPWLDLARYADTNGHEKDKRRDIWKYRDWVIDALNADMPFDRFTVEQIAGDMLPDATEAQRIATGFHRNAMTNEEGGVDPDESMYEVLVDRANTTATVWLGSTLGCAQCHNHKYDPFSQKDYFRLPRVLRQPGLRDAGLRRRHALLRGEAGSGDAGAGGEADGAAGRDQAAGRRARRDDARARRAAARLGRRDPRRRAGLDACSRRATRPRPTASASTAQPDGSILASGPNAELTTYTATFETKGEGLTGLRLEALPDPSLPRGGPGRDAYGHFRVTGLAVSIAPLAGGPGEPWTDGAARDRDAPGRRRGRRVRADGSAGRRRRSRGGCGKRRAWGINALRETPRLPRHAVLKAARPFGFPGGTRVTLRIAQEDGSIGQGVGRFRLAATTAADPLIGGEAAAAAASWRWRVPRPSAPPAATPISPPSSGAPRRCSRRRASALKAARKALVDLQLPSTLVMQDRPGFERPSYELRERGAFTSRGERMYARTPLALPPMKDSLPANRLGLARWLVDRDNPLVARVQVNRLWEQLFGRGLVETSEDFGTQGQPPSHPELLDWLAVELMDRGWSQKTLLRTIVTLGDLPAGVGGVAGARRARSLQPAVRARAALPPRSRDDPRRRARRERAAQRRRCTARACSRPQPDGIWNMPYNEDRWVESEGEDRYRRSLYTFLRRTSPYPMHMTFDATSREYCAARRVRTNTPLQALTLLNDRASFEAARALAARVAERAGSAGPGARSRFRLVVARDPKPAELARLLAYVDAERAHFARRPDAARAGRAGAGGGRSPRPTPRRGRMAANVLLNLDETVTKN